MNINEAKQILKEFGYTVANSIPQKKKILENIISFLDLVDTSNLNSEKVEKLFSELLTVAKSNTDYFVDIDDKEEAEEITSLLNNAGFHAKFTAFKGKSFGQDHTSYTLTIRP